MRYVFWVSNINVQFISTCIFLQVDVTFNLNYHKNEDTDDIPTCAAIVKYRVVNIGGSLLGAQRLKEIQPSGRAKLTAAYSSTRLDGFTCADGELLQGYMCGTFL